MADFYEKVSKTLRHHAERTLLTRWWDLRHPPADRPVIVLGCSRAGTTVVYKTLSASPEFGTLQRETHDFWVDLHPLEEKHWNTHALDASDKDRDHVARYFYTWTGRQRWVDKNNQNGLCVPYLRALFPDAIFVYVKRDPIAGYQKLYADCGLAFTPAVPSHCEQVLSKPNDVFGEIELDKWKKGHNRERVERTLERVAAVAKEMGYPQS